MNVEGIFRLKSEAANVCFGTEDDFVDDIWVTGYRVEKDEGGIMVITITSAEVILLTTGKERS